MGTQIVQVDDRYDTARFGLKAVALILSAHSVKLERHSADNGYYLWLDDSLFCSVLDKEKLQHLFALLARRV